MPRLRLQRVLNESVPGVAAAGSAPPLDPFAAVLAFHRCLGPDIGERPALASPDVVALRRRLIAEETAELDAALTTGDIVRVADALADLLYVTYSAAISFGIDLRPIFAEIHRANLAKVGGPIRADGKVLKPRDWTPPAIEPALARMRLAGVQRSRERNDPERNSWQTIEEL
jgi:predicted HAD superfamily Cof-like phosphohydrolase